MDVKGVDANLLVALDAILVECNLTRAGERLGITQSAMSGSLARLRAQFDDQLLVRNGRAYDLTPKATALLPVVREAVEAVTRTLQPRHRFDPMSSTRTFVIAASDYALSVLAGPLIDHVAAIAPNVSLDFCPLPSASSVDQDDLQRVDIVIASADRGLPGEQQELFRDRFVVIADAQHPDVVDGALSREAVARLPHVAATFGTMTTPVDDALLEAGITPRVAITCRGFTPIPYLIAGTRRIGVVPWRVANAAAALGVEAVDADVALPVLVESAHYGLGAASDPDVAWLLQQLHACV